MVTQVTGDLLKAFDDGEVNCILHQANLHHAMGGGIAKFIAKRYPEAEEADFQTDKGAIKKLGDFSIGIRKDAEGFVLNCYTQEGIGSEKGKPLTRNTRYDFVYNCFWRIKERMEEASQAEDNAFKVKIGIPYGYGSDLAGGSWPVIRAIIDSVFGECDFPVTIYKLESAPELK